MSKSISFFFRHELSDQLRSQLRVEKLLLADKDLFAGMALIESEDDPQWFLGVSSDNDRSRAAYFIKTYYERLLCDTRGIHCGECVGIDVICSRCQVEEAYLRVFNLIYPSTQSIYARSDLLPIVMCGERVISEIKQLRKQVIERTGSSREAAKLYPMQEFMPLPTRIAYWNSLDPLVQEEFRLRATQFRIYFDHHDLVSDIIFS